MKQPPSKLLSCKFQKHCIRLYIYLLESLYGPSQELPPRVCITFPNCHLSMPFSLSGPSKPVCIAILRFPQRQRMPGPIAKPPPHLRNLPTITPTVILLSCFRLRINNLLYCGFCNWCLLCPKATCCHSPSNRRLSATRRS